MPTGEHPLLFALGIALTLGLLLTGIATFQAGVFPRPAAALLLAATAGFLFAFFVAEFLPPVAGQLGSALFGVLVASGLAWMGVTLWQRSWTRPTARRCRQSTEVRQQVELSA